jgi:class 3 adenylate cyclase
MNKVTTRKRTTLAKWLGVKPGEPTRVTILFTDIIGSTALSNKIGDASWIERLTRHLEHGLELVAEHEGYKIKFIGDSFMVAFKSPLNALRFATAFHKDTGDELIKIRACIHAGLARVIDDDIYGRMINYAARLLSWKRDDGVVLSSVVKEDLAGEYGFQRSQEIFIQQNAELKNFDTQLVWGINLAEWWVTRIREAIPDFSEVHTAECQQGCMLRQSTLEEVDWIADLEARTYEEDATPGSVLRSWYRTNPNGFYVLHTESGEMIGHIDLLPLKPAGVTFLVSGSETDKWLTPDMLYPVEEAHLADAIYIESIIVKDKYNELKPKALYTILAGFESLIGRVGDTKNVKEIYGIATSAKGERLVRQLGFRLISRRSERADKYPLYVATYNDIKANIRSILSSDYAQ